MADASAHATEQLVAALLDRHGQSYAGELGLDLSHDTPSTLFRWLCACVLLSARIRADAAMSAARALAKAGWTTAGKMAASTWEERTRVLNEAGYARYDESTSRELAHVAKLALDAYGGDLRKLREKAGREPAAERRLLQDFKGIGAVGADIFCREVQLAWDELYPFADRKALQAAAKLSLPEDAGGLAKLVSRQDFPRLLAALVRSDLAHDEDAVRNEAGA